MHVVRAVLALGLYKGFGVELGFGIGHRCLQNLVGVV